MGAGTLALVIFFALVALFLAIGYSLPIKTTVWAEAVWDGRRLSLKALLADLTSWHRWKWPEESSQQGNWHLKPAGPHDLGSMKRVNVGNSDEIILTKLEDSSAYYLHKIVRGKRSWTLECSLEWKETTSGLRILHSAMLPEASNPSERISNRLMSGVIRKSLQAGLDRLEELTKGDTLEHLAN